MKEEVYTLNESYQNAVADDVITLDENRCYQGHLSAESIDSNEKTYKRENFIFVGTAENGIGYFFTLDIKEERTDAETNIILEELSQCYGIDLTAYGNDPSELTKGGKYSRTDQDEYVQRSDENEVIKAKDYTYMGIAEQEGNYGHIYQLLIPMGKDTRASDYGLSANMHGVYVEVGISSGWGEPDVIAEAEEVVESRRSSWEGNPNDFSDVEASVVKTTTAGEGAYGAVNSQKVAYEGGKYPYHEICYYLETGNDEYVTMRMILDEYYYDGQTNAVLKDIEKAYRMDLSDYYYDADAED